MQSLANWLIGFTIWIGVILVVLIFMILITNLIPFWKIGKGSIPDNAFEYRFHPDFIPEDAFLIDTHSHTTASDGWMTPEQLVRWEIANGFNAFVLTDHNTGKNNTPILALQEKYPEILIIPGYEWTTSRIHMNIIGVDSFAKPSSMNPSDEEIKQVIIKAHDLGAIVQVDHITWTVDRGGHRMGKLFHPTREQLMEWGVDGFEINNEMRWYDPKTVAWLDRLKREGNLPKTVYMGTGTDIHNPLKEWATGWTELLLTREERENITINKVKNVLLEGRTRCWVDHDYRESHELKVVKFSTSNRRKTFFAPFFGLSHGLEHIPGSTGGIISYLLWLILSYFPLRLIFRLILNLN